MNIGKWKILAVSMTLICSLAIPVLAFYAYRTPGYHLSTGIVLNGPTMQLGIYWDQACTQPATYIDFGEMLVSPVETTLTKNIFIRNEGTYVHTVFWNSTLPDTTPAITDEWTYYDYSMYIALNVTDVDVNRVLNSTYSIHIQGGPPAGTYNWTLTVWGESIV
jgi:hypothetical protein